MINRWHQSLYLAPYSAVYPVRVWISFTAPVSRQKRSPKWFGLKQDASQIQEKKNYIRQNDVFHSQWSMPSGTQMQFFSHTTTYNKTQETVLWKSGCCPLSNGNNFCHLMCVGNRMEYVFIPVNSCPFSMYWIELIRFLRSCGVPQGLMSSLRQAKAGRCSSLI